MGDFVGHFCESTLYLMLSLWWMYCGFTNYIKASNGDGQYVMELSYFCNLRGRKVPFEQALKVFFPAIAIIGELMGSKLKFRDEDGQVMGVNYIMHITLHGVYVLHGIVDWLMKKDFTCIPKKMDFFSAAFAFCWNAIGMYDHAHAKAKPALENELHFQATVPLVLLTSVFLIATLMSSSSFVLDFLRCYGLFLLGTWVCHTAFILYKPGIPGQTKNPAWDLNNDRNVNYVKVLIGVHMLLDLTFVFFIYAFCYWLVRREDRGKLETCGYMPCPSNSQESAVP